MFLTKGFIKLFNSKPRRIDINNLPDIDSETDVKQFLLSVKEEINEWNYNEELKTIIEFLVEVSEKYDIMASLEEVWIKTLYNSFDTELLQNMLDITLNTCEKKPNYFNTSVFLDFCWKVLKESLAPMSKFAVLKILQQLPQNSTLSKYLSTEPNRVNFLLDILKDTAEYLRNESILLLKKIGKNDEEICKLLAFQGIFEILSEIINEEDKVIVKDCFELMKILMTGFNKDYIRETPCVFKIVSGLINGDCNQCIIEFLITACTASDGSLYVANQRYFSKLISSIVLIAYPANGKQSLEALKLFEMLVKANASEIEALTDAQYSDTLDNILAYCALGINHRENIKVLWTIIDSYKKISENFICRVTCMPGYIETPGILPVFNWIIAKLSIEDCAKVEYLCRTIELLLFTNEPSKQLAAHLPVDLNSGTLLAKVFSLWADSIANPSDCTISLSRVLIVWLYESPETAQKMLNLVFNSLPSILKFLQGSGTSESLATLSVGLICLYCKSSELDNIIMKNIGYTDFRAKLESFSQSAEFKKALNSANLYLIDNILSYPLLKIYRSAVQAVIMHFVKGITESAPDDQKELAKFFEVREAYSTMQYLNKQSHSEVDSNELEKKVKDLEVKLNEKTNEVQELEVKLAKSRYNSSKEVRSTVMAMVNMQEKLDLTEFENLSLRRENANLNAKVQRLLEEIQTYTIKKHEIHSEIKLIEVKESLKLQINENNFLRSRMAKIEKDYEEALEVIGKLEMRNSHTGVFIQETDLYNFPEEPEPKTFDPPAVDVPHKTPEETVHFKHVALNTIQEDQLESHGYAKRLSTQEIGFQETEVEVTVSDYQGNNPSENLFGFTNDSHLKSEHQDALSFFENLTQKPSIGSLFE